MTVVDELRAQRDSLRATTSDIRQLGGILLIAPGAALAGAGIVADLTGTTRDLAALAVIAGVAIFAPIGAAVRPMRPPRRRQTTEQILAGAEILAAGGHPTALMLAVEIHRLQRIVDVKWRWIWTAIGLGGCALTLAAAALIASMN
jgi:hypothetical protein